MSKKICFFSTGFAFNRLVRMKYYEKIFPKDADMFLFTTNRDQNTSKAYEGKWTLKRTKIKSIDYKPIKVPFELRKFCKEKEIDRLINLGAMNSIFVLLIASIFTKTEYITNIVNVLKPVNKSRVVEFKNFLILFFLTLFSRKAIFVDKPDSEKTKKFLGWLKEIRFIPAPTDTNLFVKKEKKIARKKLGLPQDKKIIIFVGRISYPKGSDILIELIKRKKDILFLVVGKIMDENFEALKAKNFIHYSSKTSEELVDLYNAADLGFFVQRLYGAGLGLTTQEAMASGTPSINRDWEGPFDSPALFLVPVDVDAAEKKIDSFFKKSKKEIESLRKEARRFIEENYSGNALKDNYINYYLN